MLPASLVSLAPRFRFNFRKPIIENVVFRLHYQLTVTMLLAFVILVCAREAFGEHIKCISDQGVPANVIQNYCFFMATFTIVRHYNESLLQGGFLPHPGVGPIMESDETLHHTYYQWVPFVLFIQSICFYMPHYIWKKKEGGRIKALVDGLQYASLKLENEDMTVAGMVVPSTQTLDKRIDAIRKYIILRLRISRTWSVWLVSMEVVNLLHVMLQVWLINKFLNGQFIGLGPNVLNYKDWSHIADPLETVFPKVTKCIFHKYGPSGSIQQHDALCVMALNIIHEKIYTVLWFWLLFLFIASLLAVIWRFMSYIMFRRRSIIFNQKMFPRISSDKVDIMTIFQRCEFGDWLFLYYLGKNLQGFIFQKLFERLAKELSKPSVDNMNPYDVKVAEDLLMDQVNYDDETLPLKDAKKSS